MQFLCEYSQSFPGQWAPNDGVQLLENGDTQTFSSKFPTLKLTLLYSNTQSLVGFSVIPKCVTLNDL